MADKKMTVGGQAVIEGVMMRSPKFYSIALRRKDGSITTKVEKLESILEKKPILKKPFLRGIVMLFEMVVLGIKTLSYSAEIYSEDYEEKSKDTKKKNINWEIASSIVVSFVFAMLLFVLFPLWLTNGVKTFYAAADSTIIFNFIDGIIRLIIFLGYIVVISMFKDIRRVFEYHGAEHKAVFTYENDKPLDVKFAKDYSTQHPRCGTNFLFIVIILSILIISFVPAETFFMKFLIRIILLPVIAGMSYEIIRLLGSNENKFWAKIMLAPGLFLQNMTTRQPDDQELEIGLVALQEVLKAEGEMCNDRG